MAAGRTKQLHSPPFVGVSQLLLTHYYDHKLRQKSDDVRDHELQTLFDYCEGNPHAQALRDLVVRLQSQRLIPVAKALLENREQFSNDVADVKKQVSLYSFPADLNLLLDKVESELQSPADPFDHAATLKHLRTFYEHLHQHVGQRVQQKKPETADGTNLSQCGQALDFVRRKSVLTDKMFEFGKALYGVLSNEGVHAIKSTREYVRLCRNMTAEYALVLFFELERRLS